MSKKPSKRKKPRAPERPEERRPRFKARGGAKRKQSIGDLNWRSLTDSEHERAWQEIFEGSPRATAVMGASMIDLHLMIAISAKFIDLPKQLFKRIFDGYGPLSNLDARIEIAFALGLFDDAIRNDLQVVRRIRNGFAHTLPVIDFDTREISQELDKVILIDQIRGELGPGDDPDFYEYDSNQEKYALLILLLVMEIDVVGDEERFTELYGPMVLL